MTATPADANSTWPADTALTPELVAQKKSDLALHPHYHKRKDLRMLPAALWAFELKKIEGTAATHPSLLAAISPELGRRYGAIEQKLVEVARLEVELELRYPMLARGMMSELKNDLVQSARAAASDFVYERTGKRLSLDALTLDLTYENGNLSLSISGLSPEDAAKGPMDELIGDTTALTGAFLKDALVLLVTTSRTEQKLHFQERVLDGILEGFEDSGYEAPEAALVARKTGFRAMLAMFSKKKPAAAQATAQARASVAAQTNATAAQTGTTSGGANPVSPDAAAASVESAASMPSPAAVSASSAAAQAAEPVASQTPTATSSAPAH